MITWKSEGDDGEDDEEEHEEEGEIVKPSVVSHAIVEYDAETQGLIESKYLLKINIFPNFNLSGNCL